MLHSRSYSPENARISDVDRGRKLNDTAPREADIVQAVPLGVEKNENTSRPEKRLPPTGPAKGPLNRPERMPVCFNPMHAISYLMFPSPNEKGELPNPRRQGRMISHSKIVGATVFLWQRLSCLHPHYYLQILRYLHNRENSMVDSFRVRGYV